MWLINCCMSGMVEGDLCYPTWCVHFGVGGQENYSLLNGERAKNTGAGLYIVHSSENRIGIVLSHGNFVFLLTRGKQNQSFSYNLAASFDRKFQPVNNK